MEAGRGGRATRRQFCGLLALAMLAMAGAGHARADDAPTEAAELELKAAYLYKFANFVEWPPDAFRDTSQPIVIGVMGADALAAQLDALVQDKVVRGRGFVVRSLPPGGDARAVHILYMGEIRRDAAQAALLAVQGSHVLTVSDRRRGNAGGAMVGLVWVNQRLRFEVSMPAVQRSRLRLSALMLTAAYRVQGAGP
jgi:hypothetical protein